MASHTTTAARGCSHRQYPQYRERFNEDPARFVYHLPIRPRVRAIDDPELLAAYLHVLDEHPEPESAFEDFAQLVADIQARIERLSTADGPDTTAETSTGEVATDGGVKE